VRNGTRNSAYSENTQDTSYHSIILIIYLLIDEEIKCTDIRIEMSRTDLKILLSYFYTGRFTTIVSEIVVIVCPICVLFNL